MAFGIGRGISTPLLALNFCMYIATGAIAGWALNKNIDSSAGAGGYVGNAATFYFLPMVLIASVVGLASTLAGIHHLREWRIESLAAAASAALIAWTLTLLAFGVACKEIHIGGPRSRKLKVVEALIIVLALFELLYLLSLHAGVLGGDRFGPAYSNTGAGGANMVLVQAGEKHHGIPAAAAV
ncbi:membrane protein PM19L isoform X2 [Physcomitrium patens]|uniref:Uncharacterized protein n=1 Tax=Physcomitrium patens TaxID=3218 RepID=A9SMF8_PHYPA|nr:membrane protein PM19L-like isoform X2 [Physcomitrium patens]XP_024357390.1 membrane protein PM19L-like isoform X2 [Physcomitrium patens]PNR33137.1 hypothetical protein PHYPA_025080 [Physcomitrium patens]|eukprot:XP_024357389.1 membrane protein PM19L-like isoform X2 [Physcomitrella patens]